MVVIIRARRHLFERAEISLIELEGWSNSNKNQSSGGKSNVRFFL
jgi:hypothetical protein